MATEAQKRATIKYDAVNTVQIHLKLNKTTDRDILNKLGIVPKQTYIKQAIREKMANEDTTTDTDV